MRRLRIWCAALAAVAGSVTPVAAGTALPTLAGTTTITGTTTSYVRLAVPRRAVLGDALFLAKRDAIRVSGGRHLVGFAVVREQRGFRGPVYVGGRFSFFRRLGVPVGVPLVLDLSESPSPSSDGFVLTKGSYRFYLVTDGTAASVTFRFPGLTGSRVLRTSVPAAAGTAPTPPSVDVTAGAHAAYTFGSEYRSPRDVLAMSALLMRTDIHTESVYTNCD